MSRKSHVDSKKDDAKKRAEGPSVGGGAAEKLSEQIRTAEEEAKQHYDKLLRVMAEFENFKKRVTKESEELTKYGNEKLLEGLLPFMDDLDRVLEHVPMDASEEMKNFADGVALARKNLGSTLEKFGLKEVDAQAEPFDPAQHEAIATVDSDSYDPGTVITVHRKGYWLFDRLLRPAMVTVAKE